MMIPRLRFPEFSDSWRLVPFEALAHLKTEHFTPGEAAPSLPCVELEHLESGTGTILGTVPTAPGMSVKNRFSRGDVLFGKLRPNLRKYARPDFDGVCSQEIWVLSGAQAESGFLFQLVQTERFLAAALKTTGSRMPRAHWYTVGSALFPVPSLPEQRCIADFLGTADKEIAERRQLIDALKGQMQAVFRQLFSQAEALEEGTLSSLPGWRLLPLSAVLTERREFAENDGTYPHVSLTKEGVIPKTARYNRDFLVKSPKKAYRITRLGDICYNPANLKFGVICRNRLGDGIFSPIYAAFSVNPGFHPAFVELSVTRPSFLLRALRYQEGTVYERMSVRPEYLLALKIAVPEPARQREFAQTAALLEEQIAQEEGILRDLILRKQGLLQRMLP